MRSTNTVRLKADRFSSQLVFSFHSFDHHIVGLGRVGCFGKIIGVGWALAGYWGVIKRVNIMDIYYIFLLTYHVTVILRKCRHILQVQLNV